MKMPIRFMLAAVFLCGPTTAVALPFDHDGDGDVDLGDYVDFIACMAGPEVPVSGDCADTHDRGGDGDVDLADFLDFQLSFTGPAPHGACCQPDGTCSSETAYVCDMAGGEYQGDETACDPNPCPQPDGACCYLDGSCVIQTAAACDQGGGDWQGMDTVCDPNPCPPPRGACCFDDSPCTMMSEEDCEQAEGYFKGVATTCDPNPCIPCPDATIRVEVLTDRYPEETTWEVIDQASGTLIASAGPYAEPSTLYTHDVCVRADGCYDFTIFDSYGDGLCCGYGEGAYDVYFEGVRVGSGGEFASRETVPDMGGCVFEGACCDEDGSCDAVTEADCVAGGGTWQGRDTVCDPNPCPQPGACCEPDGTCSDGFEAACAGAWQGPGVRCADDRCDAYGACCQPDGSCEYTLAGGCTEDWQGAGTTCDPNLCPQPASGACCLPNGGCAEVTRIDCEAALGTYQGDGVPCSSVSCPQPAEPTQTQLAGNSLAIYPYFEYVRAFNENATVEVAIDPTRYPGIVGRTADIYVAFAKTAIEWAANPSLSDVTPGGALTVTFGGSTIQANTFTVAGAYDLDADAGVGLGVGYDVVVDFDRDGRLSTADYIDGLGDEAGLYAVHDTTAPGPLAVTEIIYSGGSWLGQDTYYPTDIASMDELPLVVISHGNGHDYRWYDHIGYHLASYGYVVMSHENQTGPGIETASTTTLTNTDYIIGNQDSIQGGVLDGHLDSHRITWIGHSRGGEGITRAYDRLYDGAYTPDYYTIDDIVLLSSMLPVDFLKTSQSNPHDVNYHLWTASGDADVNGSASCDLCQTFHLHERATRYRMSTVVQGAGHGDFHDGSGGDVFTGPCHITPRSRVHDIQKGLFLPLIKHYIEGNVPAMDFFWRQYERFHPIGVDTSNPCVVVSNEYRNGAETGNYFIDDYQTQTSTGVSSSGGGVTFTVNHVVEGRMDDNNTSFSWTSSDPFNGATQNSSEGSDDGRGVVFDWNGSNAYYEWEVIPSWRDFSDDLYLSFRAAQGTQHPYTLAEFGDLTFTVTLRDGDGTTSSINIGAYGGGLEQPYDRSGGWHNEMEVIRIRLTDFLHNGSGLNLGDIVAVRLDVGPAWGSNEGRIVVDELMLTSDVMPAAATALYVTVPDGVPPYVPPDEPIVVDVDIVAVGDTIVAGSPTAHYRYAGGSYLTSSLAHVGGTTYRATLPDPNCHDEPEFYFCAEGVATGVVTAPATAPTATFTTTVGELTTLVGYDFESDPGFSVSGDASDGQWDHGIPVACDRGDPPTDYDGSGQCWLTDNSTASECNSDVDGGTTTLTSNVLDISGLDDPILAYARWYNNVFGANPEANIFEVEVSSDGGANWVDLETVGPAGPEVEGGWYFVTFRIADYVTLTSQFRVRWHASDIGSGAVVEAAVDAFAIYDLACD